MAAADCLWWGRMYVCTCVFVCLLAGRESLHWKERALVESSLLLRVVSFAFVFLGVFCRWWRARWAYVLVVVVVGPDGAMPASFSIGSSDAPSPPRVNYKGEKKKATVCLIAFQLCAKSAEDCARAHRQAGRQAGRLDQHLGWYRCRQFCRKYWRTAQRAWQACVTVALAVCKAFIYYVLAFVSLFSFHSSPFFSFLLSAQWWVLSACCLSSWRTSVRSWRTKMPSRGRGGQAKRRSKQASKQTIEQSQALPLPRRTCVTGGVCILTPPSSRRCCYRLVDGAPSLLKTVKKKKKNKTYTPPSATRSSACPCPPPPLCADSCQGQHQALRQRDAKN